MHHARYLRVVAGAAWDYSHRFAALQFIEAAHVRVSSALWRVLGSAACRRSVFVWGFERWRGIFWEVCRQKAAVAVNLYMLTARIQSPVDITVKVWSLKKAVMSDWCQSSQANGIKLCLSDINPQSFLFTQWHLQFIKAPGLSTTPYRTIGFCFPFWKISARLSVTRECSPFKREHLAQPPTAPSEETGD